MQAHEQVAVPLVGEVRAFAEFDEHVFFAGELDVEAFFFQFVAQQFGNGEDDIFFVGLLALRTGVLASVSGVDDDGADFTCAGSFVLGLGDVLHVFFGSLGLGCFCLGSLGLLLSENLRNVCRDDQNVPVLHDGGFGKFDGLALVRGEGHVYGEAYCVFRLFEDECFLDGEPVEREAVVLCRRLGVDTPASVC